mmetsp:Transcript_109632/g.199620  ORF Transcript_109632/g.199620 Transcript_109632/m.199620 type:complete len:84 (+) Transcript_109632:40-291(+)
MSLGSPPCSEKLFFFVLFYKMGKCVVDFRSAVRFGISNYGIDCTHSILRMATASPVSGSDDLGMMHYLALRKKCTDLGHTHRS